MLLGASGVGKSTLANALLGEHVLETGDVREQDHRGRHTTTTRSMVTLPLGGVLIDTPGIRSLGLLEFEEGLALAFPDIEELAAQCRFRDCTHRSEPGCAVRAAVAGGGLDAARMSSYEKLQKELAYSDRVGDPIALRAEMRKWRAIHKSVRATNKKH